jgi:hypothetical protein
LHARLNKLCEATEHARDGNVPDSDIMNAALMDSSFADEEIARELLNDNFDRLANSMDRISKSRIFSKGKLQRIGELGGGTGIIGMWLTINNLCEQCEIFDHAQNPLSIGSKWATNLSLKNVAFHHISYAELAVNGSQNCEFAFAEHGVDLGYIPKHLDWSQNSPAENDFQIFRRYKELAGALKKILLPTGIGLIGGGVPSPASLSLLCTALREQQLFIDWELSSNVSGFLLYVRPQGQIIINSPEDEALAILADAVPSRKIHPAEARSLEIMFRQGTKFAEIYSEADVQPLKFHVSAFFTNCGNDSPDLRGFNFFALPLQMSR